MWNTEMRMKTRQSRRADGDCAGQALSLLHFHGSAVSARILMRRQEMPIRIKRTIEKMPGGMMVIPLLCGAVITTVAPNTAVYFGSFTGALFTGAIPIIAVFYVCLGSTIKARSLPAMLGRGGMITATKIGLGIGAGFLFGHFIGTQPIQAGWFAGISTLAVVAAINDTNGGLYMGLMEHFGRREDAGLYSVMAVEAGPFITMITLGVAGLSSFPWQTLVGAILPLAVGIALGNLDSEMRDFLGVAAPVLIPFFALGLGTGLNLGRVWEAGLMGLALGLGIVLVSSILLALADRVSGGTGIAGIAAATTAGNAAAVPALVAAANHNYAAAAGPATALVASSVIVTTFTVPLLASWWHRRTQRKLGIRAKSESVAGEGVLPG